MELIIEEILYSSKQNLEISFSTDLNLVWNYENIYLSFLLIMLSEVVFFLQQRFKRFSKNLKLPNMYT